MSALTGTTGAVPNPGLSGDMAIPSNVHDYFADAANGNDAEANKDPKGLYPYKTIDAALTRMYRDGLGFYFPTLRLSEGDFRRADDGNQNIPLGMRVVVQGAGMDKTTISGMTVDTCTFLSLRDVRIEQTDPNRVVTADHWRPAVWADGPGTFCRLHNIDFGPGWGAAIYADFSVRVKSTGKLKAINGLPIYFAFVNDGSLWEHYGEEIDVAGVPTTFIPLAIFSKSSKVKLGAAMNVAEPFDYSVWFGPAVTDIDDSTSAPYNNGGTCYGTNYVPNGTVKRGRPATLPES